jgi:tetratricopeptide (TPR) repeat protein
MEVHGKWVAFTALVLAAACATQTPGTSSTRGDEHADDAKPVLFTDLGDHHRAITTRSSEAQRWFDQGLVLAFAFNHDEAIRSFREAARLDPDCAMAWWGIALANGPHINFPMMTPEHSQVAWDALEHARGVASRASPVERELIEALSARYVKDPPEARTALDTAYADAMRRVWHAHPDDADIGTLFAEAAMDLHPWDLWTLDGKPKPGTDEIIGALEAVLARAPLHPGANHLYIHVMEASPDAGRALASADRLRTLVPGASHLVHMPAHIDVRIGHYAEASFANERAMEVDRKRAERTGRTGFYHVYMAHNAHFLAYASMMEGRSEEAIRSARAMVDGLPAELKESMGPLVDGYLPVMFHVFARFGRWEDILREPEFPPLFGAANCVRFYARGIALTALGRLDEAQHELDQLDALVAVMDERTIGNNPAKVVLEIPRKLLRGELEFRRGNVDGGLALLREAVAIDDQLAYDEPPDWMMPARHTLGAALVQAKRYPEAETVYREDLRRNPENGWSLFGLAQCLTARGEKAEASAVRARFEKAWARADVKLKSSCFCQPGT